MSGILEKLCWGRAIGVYFSGDNISITDVGNTVKGQTTLNQQSFKIADHEPASFLTDTLQEYVKTRGGKTAQLCLGIKPEQMFFITLSAQYEQQEQLRDKLLDNVGFRNAEERNNVVADYFRINKVKMPNSQLWSVGACKKQIAEELYAAVNKAGFKNALLKPAPSVMSSFSMKSPKKAKHWKVFVQIFLNETGGLAILVVEKNPVCWKRISFSRTEPIEKIESAVRSILIQSTVAMARPVIDGIILEGPKAEEFGGKLYELFGIEAVIADGPGYTDEQCSYSLAMSAKVKEETQFDLFHELRPKPSIKQIFPWKLAAMIVLTAGCMAVMMWQKSAKLAESYGNLKQQNSKHKWASSKKNRELYKMRKALLMETEAVEKFILSRVIWSDYLRDIPARLPTNVSLDNIWAISEFRDVGGKKEGGTQKVKKSFSIRGITLFEKGHASPEQIDAFLESLRKVDLLERDFPKVQLADIKWRRQGECETASFTVLALPKKTDGDGGGESEKDGKGGKDTKGEKGKS